MRAYAYKIDGNVAEHELPFVASNARIINEIAKADTCEELEAFRLTSPQLIDLLMRIRLGSKALLLWSTHSHKTPECVSF